MRQDARSHEPQEKTQDAPLDSSEEVRSGCGPFDSRGSGRETSESRSGTLWSCVHAAGLALFTIGLFVHIVFFLAPGRYGTASVLVGLTALVGAGLVYLARQQRARDRRC